MLYSAGIQVRPVHEAHAAGEGCVAAVRRVSGEERAAERSARERRRSGAENRGVQGSTTQICHRRQVATQC